MPSPRWHNLEHNTHMTHGYTMARLGTMPFMSPLKKYGTCPVSVQGVVRFRLPQIQFIVQWCTMVKWQLILDLEQFYPILPSKPLSLTCCSGLLVEIVTVTIIISHSQMTSVTSLLFHTYILVEYHPLLNCIILSDNWFPGMFVPPDSHVRLAHL